MRRPSKRLIITFLLCLPVGFALSWLMMIGLGITLRAYGISTLTIVAILNAIIFIFILDGPLNLKTFEWPDPVESEEEQNDNARHFLIASFLTVVIGGGLALWLSNGNFYPIAASTQSVPIDNLLDLHFWVIGFLFALVSVFMVYSIVVFRRRDGDDGDGVYMHGNAALEIIWTVVPLIVVFYFGYLGVTNLNEITAPQPDEMVVEVDAFQWAWNFSYPEYGDKKSAQLYLPRNRPILFKMTSRDVLHSFWVPEFRVKQDIVPGRTTELRVTPNRDGEYKVRCAEICGLAHTNMLGDVVVLPPEEFEAWATGQPIGGVEVDLASLSPPERGQFIAQAQGCTSCHSIDGSQLVGPTWLGIYGREEELDDGSVATVDEAYIRESILQPHLKLVAGFGPVMPDVYANILSDEDMNDIIAFMQSLSN